MLASIRFCLATLISWKPNSVLNDFRASEVPMNALSYPIMHEVNEDTTARRYTLQL